MKDAVIVLSGGMDSVTLLYERAAEIALAVTFDYGSNHNRREEACAKEHCRRLGIEQVTIPLGFIGQYFESSLLAGAEAVPEGPYAAENMQSTVVPFRNGIMLSVAAGLAESRGLRKVLIANHDGDHVVYPDCREGFVAAMDRAVQEGTDGKVQVEDALHADEQGGHRPGGRTPGGGLRADVFVLQGRREALRTLRDVPGTPRSAPRSRGGGRDGV